MDLMQTLREQAAAKPMRVAFPEGENETMMQAVAKIAAEHLAECVLVGDGGKLKELADERGISLDGIEIVDVTDEEANAAVSLRDYNALMAMQGKAPLAAAALPALSREPVLIRIASLSPRALRAV